MSNTQRDIARVVKTLLAHQSKNQTELAAHMNVGHSAISKTLNNPHRSWTVDELLKLADFFEVSPMLFLDDPEKLVRTRHGASRTEPGEGEISNTITSREFATNFLDDTLLQLVS